MPISGLHTDDDNYNLAAEPTVFSYTPDADNARRCSLRVDLGSVAKPLCGTGGAYELTIIVGDQTWNGGSETLLFGSAARAFMQSAAFDVRAGEQVDAKVKSPNAADNDVYGKATISDVSDVVDAHIAKAGAKNKWKLNQDTGDKTVYDDDETTVLYETEMDSEENGTVVIEQPK